MDGVEDELFEFFALLPALKPHLHLHLEKAEDPQEVAIRLVVELAASHVQ